MKKMIRCTLAQNNHPVLINPDAIACVMMASEKVNVTRIVAMAQSGANNAPLLIDVVEPLDKIEKMMNRRGLL